ncbi:hypothetical protein F2Q68_00028016 [Brassica cretica]|uniref:Uncharacterized protein n=1 Tax=Brassica cretica TaxID=69181 RepID=A0A8S9ILU6_BRACR|nr:hypothetical protein F2Q68_00028016 [Brassica cretica]
MRCAALEVGGCESQRRRRGSSPSRRSQSLLRCSEDEFTWVGVQAEMALASFMTRVGCGVGCVLGRLWPVNFRLASLETFRNLCFVIDLEFICEFTITVSSVLEGGKSRSGLGLGRDGVSLVPGYLPSVGIGVAVASLFCLFGRRFQMLRDVVYKPRLGGIARLMCYSGDDLISFGIRGNEENLTFLGSSSMVESGNQFQRISKDILAECVAFSGRAKLVCNSLTLEILFKTCL